MGKVDHEGKVGSAGEPLPAFRHPPLIEVVLAVGFDPLAGLRVVDIYDYYSNQYGAEDFPIIEERPPYVMPVERFGERARIPDVKIELLDRPPPLRHWFVSGDGTELVQLQTDWFARNWRKRSEGSEYCRYPNIRDPFRDDLVSFSAFLKDRGIGSLAPTQCEITYINRIERDEIWSDHGDVAQVLRYWQSSNDSIFPARPEQVQFDVSYLIPDAAPVGRLHVSLQPAFATDSGDPIFVLTLTARGAAKGGSIEGAMDFLDLGHDLIVRCFAEVTTPQMHAKWEREA